MSRYDWTGRAICAEYGPRWLEDRDLVDKKRDCGACPVRINCLAHAIATRATEVYQAGLSIGTRPIDGVVEEVGS